MVSYFKYIVSTCLALIAFAGNSVLCRLALAEQAIDATSFTVIRIVSGALVLWCLVLVTQNKRSNTMQRSKQHRAWSAALLFAYAAGFSYAYIVLDTGIGALILFGCVQLTMITVSLLKKERFNALQYIGLVVAFAGLVYLVLGQQQGDTLTTSFLGFALMAIAGVAWAGYTLLGRGSTTPLLDTCNNFIYAVPFCAVLLLVYWVLPANVTNYGMILAIASGAVTSGLGYAIWYVALEGLSRIQAGVVQLLVPVIAAIGGAIWASEALSAQLIISQIVILGGIALVMFSPKRKQN